MTADTKRSIHYLSGGLVVTVVPEGDERVRDLPPDAVAVHGGSLYVSRAHWPRLEAELSKRGQ